jgi:hypothetical protein
LVASGNNAVITGSGSKVSITGDNSVTISGSGATVSLAATQIRESTNNGVLASGTGAKFYLTQASLIENVSNDGLTVTGPNATVLVQDSAIRSSGGDGVSVFGAGSTATQVTLLRAKVEDSAEIGVYAQNVNTATSVVQILGTTISGASLAGVASDGSNVDIGNENLATNTGKASSITNTGAFGVTAELNSQVRIRNTAISGVVTGIDATNSSGTTQLIATGNTITTSGSGVGIAISANRTAGSVVRAQLLSNRISTSGTAGITLVTVNPPAAPIDTPKVIQISDAADALALGAVNLGTTVRETPVPNPTSTPVQPTLVDWSYLPYPAPPPTPIVPTPP